MKKLNIMLAFTVTVLLATVSEASAQEGVKKNNPKDVHPQTAVHQKPKIKGQPGKKHLKAAAARKKKAVSEIK